MRCRDAIEALTYRAEWLKEKIETKAHSEKALPFMKRELNATIYAIEVLEQRRKNAFREVKNGLFNLFRP